MKKYVYDIIENFEKKYESKIGYIYAFMSALFITIQGIFNKSLLKRHHIGEILYYRFLMIFLINHIISP